MPVPGSPPAVGRHAIPRVSWFRVPRQTPVHVPAREREAAHGYVRVARVRKVGYAVLALQLAGFCAWSALLYHRSALTWDFAVYHQPWYLIAHGHLNPDTSIESMPFWRNDAEFAIWPLAVFYWLGPHSLTLLWLQDIGVVAAEVLAFGWMCDLAARCRDARAATWLAATGLTLLVVSPWLWWSISFDFHLESVALPFAVLLARDLARGRRRMWWWVVPVLACGGPAAVYVVGIGAGGILAARRYWRRGAVLVAIGAAYSVFVVTIGADHGAPLARHYGYLAVGVSASYVHGRLTTPGGRLSTGQMSRDILSHPGRVVEALWQKRVDINAALLPGGAIGILFRPLLPLITVGLLSAILSAGWRFAQPLFQMLPVYVLVPLGTVAVLAWLARRHRRTALVCAGLLAAQALGWAVVWGPRVPAHWLRISSAAAATLAKVRAQIPESDEVVASQGVVGPFSGRLDVHALAGTSRTPVSGTDVWFVITPTAGTELQTTASSMAFVGQLAGPMRARLVAHANGVWAFRWHRPSGQHWVVVPPGTSGVPGWTAAGTAGRAVTTGAVDGWHAASDGHEGYVSDGIQWLEPPGSYTAQVVLSATGPANVEVWDDNGKGVLLARRSVPAAASRQTVALPVDVTSALRSSVYSGWGLFSARFVPPVPGQRIEVRVWTDGSDTVQVYSARIQERRQ
jgi:Predicted membrane protein (DUF2079)